MKQNKGGAILWGGIVVALELIFFLGLIVAAFALKDIVIAITAILPLLVAVFTAYFLWQRLGEIKEEQKHGDEYDKY